MAFAFQARREGPALGSCMTAKRKERVENMGLPDGFCIPGMQRRTSPGSCMTAILELLALATSHVKQDTQVT
eukprot:scaffold62604_cov21-Tisochrysis_lutea.AAC.1